MKDNKNIKESKNKLSFALIFVFFAIVVLIGAKDHISKLIGSDNVTGGYTTSADVKKIIREFIEENPALIVRSIQKMPQQMQNDLNQEVLKDFIQNNPELIVKSVQDFHQKKYKEQIEKRNEQIKKSKDDITSLKDNPVLGNPKSDVKIAKFFDYRCGHCKSAHKNVESLIKDDKNVAVVLRVVPLLGPDSERAAKASVAAFLISPKKFPKFHEKLFKAHSLNHNNLMKLALESGYDKDIVADKMNSKEVEGIIMNNKKAAGTVGLQGVPGFLIGEEFVGGNIPTSAMKEKIKNLRGK